MRCKTVEVINKLGIHGRASAKLVSLASRFESDIYIFKEKSVPPEQRSAQETFELAKKYSDWDAIAQQIKNNGSVENSGTNAKSIMGCMLLTAQKGDYVSICAAGADEDHAVIAIAGLISARFDEAE